MKKKIIAIIVGILLIGSGTWVVVKKKESIAALPTMASYPLPVDVAEVKDGSILISSRYLGQLNPFHSADISPRISGNILTVAVREGDRIRKGQILVTIDERALKEKENAQMLDAMGAESQLAGLKSVYEAQAGIYDRDKMLFKEDAISLEMLQKSKAQKDLAFAQMKSGEERVKALKNIARSTSIETSYARLYSPVDGIVAKRLQEPGDLAVPGKPVLRVEETSKYKVVIQVPEKDMPLMKNVRQVVLSNGSGRIDAKITRIYPSVTAGTLGTVEIDIAKRPFDVVSGGTVGVEVITGKTEQGAIIPLSSILETQKGSFIFKVESAGDGKAPKVKLLPVTVHGKNSVNACVASHIRTGERVVIGDEGKLLRLTDGMAVLPVKMQGGEK